MLLTRASGTEARYLIIFISLTGFTGPGGNGNLMIKKL